MSKRKTHSPESVNSVVEVLQNNPDLGYVNSSGTEFCIYNFRTFTQCYYNYNDSRVKWNSIWKHLRRRKWTLVKHDLNSDTRKFTRSVPVPSFKKRARKKRPKPTLTNEIHELEQYAESLFIVADWLKSVERVRNTSLTYLNDPVPPPPVMYTPYSCFK